MIPENGKHWRCISQLDCLFSFFTGVKVSFLMTVQVFLVLFSISTFQAPRQHWSRQDKLSTIHHFFLFFPSALPHYLLSKWNRQDQIHIITLFYTLTCYWNLALTDDIYQACTTFSQRPYLAFWTILHVLIYNPHPLPNFQL